MPNLEQAVSADLDLITSAAAAEILACSVWTVGRMVRRGELTPAAKMPGARGGYLFTREHVETVLRESAA